MGIAPLVPDGFDARAAGLLGHTDLVCCRQGPGCVRDLPERAQNAASLDQSLIEQITQIASIAIERTQRDAMLRRSEALLAQAQRLSSTCSFSWRVATEEIAWSEEVFRIFELDRIAPVTNELFRSRVHPEDFPFCGR